MKPLLLKKIFHNKLNFFPLIVIWLSINIILFFNWRSGRELTLINQITSEQVELELVISQLKDEHSNPDLEKQSKDHIENSLEDTEKQLYLNRDLLLAYKAKDYQKAYSMMAQKIAHTRKRLNNFQNSETLSALKRDEAYYRYLAEKNIKGDAIQPIFGWSFSFELWRDSLPILLTFALIFVLSQVFSQAHYHHLSIYLLCPGHFLLRTIKQIGGGLLFSIGAYLLSLLYSFTLASLFFEMGSLDLPVLTYDDTLQMIWQPLKTQLWQTSILQIVSLLSLVLTIYLIAFLVKDKLLASLISFFSILGLMILTYFIVPLQEVAHWIPYHYLQSLAITTGYHHHAIQINRLEAGFGIFLNLTYSILLLGLIYLIDQYRRKKHKNA